MRAEGLRETLGAQRQTHRLIAREPTRQASRALAALQKVTDAAEKGAKDLSNPRPSPYAIIDDKLRAQEAAAEKSAGELMSFYVQNTGVAGKTTRAHMTERVATKQQQAVDRAALRAAHKAERTRQDTSRRGETSPDGHASSDTERKAARAALQTLHAKDRSGLAEAHALEMSALNRVHVTERLASRQPGLAEATSRQRDQVVQIRSHLTAFRDSVRLASMTRGLSKGQAEGAIATLKRVAMEDHQKQQRHDAVMRGTGSAADRAAAAPAVRDRADRDVRSDRVGGATNREAGSASTRVRKGSGRGR